MVSPVRLHFSAVVSRGQRIAIAKPVITEAATPNGSMCAIDGGRSDQHSRAYEQAVVSGVMVGHPHASPWRTAIQKTSVTQPEQQTPSPSPTHKPCRPKPETPRTTAAA